MEISRHWRLQGQRYNLAGSVCTECGKPFFTPKMICDSCNSTKSNVYRFNERYTQASVPAHSYEPAHK